MPEELIKVFISYSWDSTEHQERVRALADRLQEDGLEAILDFYASAPAEGWPQWMERNIRDADFVVLVCTETYGKRVEGKEAQGKGLGVKWESVITYNQIYQADSKNDRFVPVLFAASDKAYIPIPLQGYSFYPIDSEEGYQSLYWRLTKQDQIPKPQRGTIKPRPPIERKPLFASPSSGESQAAQPAPQPVAQP